MGLLDWFKLLTSKPPMTASSSYGAVKLKLNGLSSCKYAPYYYAQDVSQLVQTSKRVEGLMDHPDYTLNLRRMLDLIKVSLQEKNNAEKQLIHKKKFQVYAQSAYAVVEKIEKI